MNNTNNNTTDNIYELSCYNSNGLVDVAKLRLYSSTIFFIIFFTTLTLLYIIQRINYLEDIDMFASLDFYNEFIHFHYEVIASLLMEKVVPSSEYIHNLIVSFIVAIAPTIYFIFSKIKASKFQAILSSAGLSQYYYYKRKGQNIYIKFKKGQKNSYTNFVNQRENLTQMLNKENLQFKRWKNNGVIIQYSHEFPTLKELSKLKIQDYIKSDKLFLGIGLPKIGEDYEKSDLIMKKYLARYLNFLDIPQGIANLGSAGGGKSNTMIQYLYSIFANFDKVHSFYMVDFKGGIEAEPIKDLEFKHKTGKIQVFDDNRIGLYKALKKLHFINKSRMRYLKSTKQKKFTSDFIILIFDELAEILDYNPSTKEERKIQEKISFYIESLLRTGRSQGFKIFYSTQSYLSTSSGLSSGMKNNTKLKIAHQLGSNLQVGSIKPTEELNEIGITPTKYDVGKNVVINEADNTIYEVRSLYIADDFIDSIKINTGSNQGLEEELKIHYQAVYEEMLQDLKLSKQEDDNIYSLQNIADDLGLLKIESELPLVNQIKEEVKKDTKAPKISIAKAIQEKKKTKESENNACFLESLK